MLWVYMAKIEEFSHSCGRGARMWQALSSECDWGCEGRSKKQAGPDLTQSIVLMFPWYQTDFVM
jgi:hypothetical protein